jgi:hypothetical protein
MSMRPITNVPPRCVPFKGPSINPTFLTHAQKLCRNKTDAEPALKKRKVAATDGAQPSFADVLQRLKEEGTDHKSTHATGTIR